MEERFRLFIEASVGLDLGGSRTSVLSSRFDKAVQRAVRAGREPTASGLAQDLIDDLTIGETYFFREPAAFDWLSYRALPDLCQAHPRRRVVVWSAGCSTGEEAFSAAFAAARVGLEDRVRVVGFDVSRSAIAHAKNGRYKASSFRGPAAGSLRDVVTREGKWFQMPPTLARTVKFTTANLCDSDSLGRLPRPDIVLCRNVLLYMTDEARTRAVSHLAEVLEPDGWLVVGATDPAPDHHLLERRRERFGFAYRKVRATTPPRAAPPA